MAAGVAALRDVLTPTALIALNDRGDALRDRLDDTFAGAGLPVSVTGMGSMMCLHSPDPSWIEVFFFAALAAGFFLARRGMIALSLDVADDQLDEFCQFVERWVADPLAVC